VRVGILTGGGDCPGLNAAIRAVVRKAEREFGDEVLGFRDGWTGVVEGRYEKLDIERMRGTLPRGGTVLGSSRSQPGLYEHGLEQAVVVLAELGVDAMIAIGGDGTLAAASRFHEIGGKVVGVPKTIDNDIPGTEMTFGFNTAVQIATDAIDRLHTTAESHDRVMVVEVMGRHAGHVAVHSGIAGGATLILIPEHPFDIDDICARLVRRHEHNRYASIVVVAEGAVPAPGTGLEPPDAGTDMWGHRRLGGIGTLVAEAVQERTGFEARVTVLGHVQRGGTPTAFDRVLSTRFGIAAIDAVHEGAWGQMVALHSDEITLVPLADVVGHERTCPDSLYYGVAGWFWAE
jgi:6-phosphofructokinase 1